MARRYHHARNQKQAYSLSAVLLEPQQPVTIDDLAGPLPGPYDEALAEHEVIRRHFPELLTPYLAPDAQALDKRAKDFLAEKLDKVRPLPIDRRNPRRYAGK